jgi:hypothetical protein
MYVTAMTFRYIAFILHRHKKVHIILNYVRSSVYCLVKQDLTIFN